VLALMLPRGPTAACHRGASMVKLVDLLMGFLVQNGGKRSSRAREKEFKKLTDREIQSIEQKYADIFI
jgi:hypothetical protein